MVSSTLEQLGNSLNHWQALYVISILVAVVSTFSIIIFNFHLTDSKHGHRLSNYAYVLASLLSVLSTIVIITKTRAINKEQARLTKIHEDAQDAQERQDKLLILQTASNNLTLQSRLAGIQGIVNLQGKQQSADQQRVLQTIKEILLTCPRKSLPIAAGVLS